MLILNFYVFNFFYIFLTLLRVYLNDNIAIAIAKDWDWDWDWDWVWQWRVFFSLCFLTYIANLCPFTHVLGERAALID